MAQTQTFPIPFNCIHCKHPNTYNVTLLVGETQKGTREQIFRCKNCNNENLVKVEGDYRFPEKDIITRGE